MMQLGTKCFQIWASELNYMTNAEFIHVQPAYVYGNTKMEF